MATIEYSNCSYDSSTLTYTPYLNSTGQTNLATVLEEGIYTEDVTTYISYITIQTSIAGIIGIFLNNIVPYAMFATDATDLISALSSDKTVTNLIAVLNEMLFTSDVSATVESLGSALYSEATITIYPDYCYYVPLTEMGGLGLSFQLNADTDTNVSVVTTYRYCPIYKVTGVLTSTGTSGTYYAPVLSNGTAYTTTHVESEWKAGYNANVIFEGISSEYNSINYNTGTYYKQYYSTNKSKLLSTHFDSISSMKHVGWGFLSDTSYTTITNVTITFNTEITLIDSNFEFSGTVLDSENSIYTGVTFDVLCQTNNCSTEETVDSLTNTVSSLSTQLADATNITSAEVTDFESGWAQYSSSYTPTVYSYGNMVMFNGAITNSSAVTSSSSDIQVMTLPDGYAPIANVRVLCQGSTTYHYLMTVDTDGLVYISRYGGNGSYTDLSSGRWLVFNIVWITDGSSS